MLRLLLAAAALVAGFSANAQDVGGAWKVERDRVSLRVAKVGLPSRAVGTALTKTGEFSHKGEAIDNFAQYESADGKIFATAYVYLPTYADTALAAYATDQAIAQRFAATSSATQTSVPFAGVANGAIRQVFTGTLRGRR